MSTINDVAKLSGVSKSTVSKAYNDYAGISKATKDKIFAAAKELGYIPSKSAIDLSRGIQPYLGLILNNLSTHSAKDEYILRMLSGVQERCSERGLDLTLFTTAQVIRQNYSYVDFCKRHCLMGAIIHGININDPNLIELIESPLPCVLVDMEYTNSTTAFVSTDNEHAAKTAVQLLHKNGAKKICHILGTKDALVTLHREQGFLNEARNLGYKKENVIVVPGEFNETIAYKNVKALLKAHKDIQGIFAASDLMALGAKRAIEEAGLIVGQDVALIGFDGLTALEYTNPQISTIQQDFHNMGCTAVDTLISISHKKVFCDKNYVPYTLLDRDSCKLNRVIPIVK